MSEVEKLNSSLGNKHPSGRAASILIKVKLVRSFGKSLPSQWQNLGKSLFYRKSCYPEVSSDFLEKVMAVLEPDIIGIENLTGRNLEEWRYYKHVLDPKKI